MDDVWIFSPKAFQDHNGILSVLADAELPILLRRVFTVQANSGDVRGHHAHRAATQVLFAIAGVIEVGVRNSLVETTFSLSVGSGGLVLPPMNWAWQKFLSPDSILLVLTDHDYDEDDYIRDKDEFETILNSSQIKHP